MVRLGRKIANSDKFIKLVREDIVLYQNNTVYLLLI